MERKAEEEKMGKDKQQPRIGDIRKIAEEYFIRHGRRLTFRQALLYYRNYSDKSTIPIFSETA